MATKAPDAPKSVYELLPLVQREIGAVGKDQRNQHGRYNFRGIDDVLNAVGPALAKYGVVTTMRVVEHSLEELPHKDGYRVRVILKLRVTFYGQDGSSVQSCAIGEGQDYNGDKATNKAMAVGYKYAVLLGLAIPVAPGALEDSDRDDKDRGAVAAPSKRHTGHNKPAPAPARTSGKVPPADEAPVHPETLKDLTEVVLKLADGDKERAMVGASNAIGHVNSRRPEGITPAQKLADLTEIEARLVLKGLSARLAAGAGNPEAPKA